MEADLVITIMKQSLGTGAMIMLPILLTGLTVGIMVGVLQAATQVNEPTLTFVPKVAAVGLISSLLLPWALDRMVAMLHMVMNQISQVFVR